MVNINKKKQVYPTQTSLACRILVKLSPVFRKFFAAIKNGWVPEWFTKVVLFYFISATTHTHARACIHTHTHTHTHAHRQIDKHTRTYTLINTHTHTHTLTDTQKRTHSHTQIGKRTHSFSFRSLLPLSHTLSLSLSLSHTHTLSLSHLFENVILTFQLPKEMADLRAKYWFQELARFLILFLYLNKFKSQFCNLGGYSQNFLSQILKIFVTLTCLTWI